MRSFLTSLAALLAASMPIAAQPRVIQSPAGAGSALVETREGYRIESPEGAATPIDAPAGVILSAYRELGDGWLAAGHVQTDAGSELVLLRGRGGTTERVAPPSKPEAAFRTAPAPLLERGELAGLAWLEGDGGEKNAVMASGWTGEAFEPPRTVSPWTGEAQLALRAAVLDDGSALLVWAAVEAGDDDIFWSRASAPAGAGWSSPARVHPDNDGPDITPALAAVRGGAVAAWGQRLGRHYRLRLARFAGGSWTPVEFDSAPGAFRPTVFPTAAGVGFLYSAASPKSWNVLELDPAGRPSRRGTASRISGEERPLVVAGETASLGLRFVTDAAAGAALTEPAEPRPIDWTELP